MQVMWSAVRRRTIKTGKNDPGRLYHAVFTLLTAGGGSQPKTLRPP
jgi:hypothetical protein